MSQRPYVPYVSRKVGLSVESIKYVDWQFTVTERHVYLIFMLQFLCSRETQIMHDGQSISADCTYIFIYCIFKPICFVKPIMIHTHRHTSISPSASLSPSPDRFNILIIYFYLYKYIYYINMLGLTKKNGL